MKHGFNKIMIGGDNNEKPPSHENNLCDINSVRIHVRVGDRGATRCRKLVDFFYLPSPEPSSRLRDNRFILEPYGQDY